MIPQAHIKFNIHKYRETPSKSKKYFSKYTGGFCNELFFDERGDLSWTIIEGDLIPKKSLREKYPGYYTYKIPIKKHSWDIPNVVPCRALAVATITTEPESHDVQFMFGYESFIAFKPCDYKDKTVKVNTDFTTLPDFAENMGKIKKSKWVQLGAPGDHIIILMKLIRNPIIPPTTPWSLKDDITGEFYPYIISTGYCLVKIQEY